MLAARFGGTPWAWRHEADELDWGTVLRLLQDEMDRMED